jgi:hypothetical protein
MPTNLVLSHEHRDLLDADSKIAHPKMLDELLTLALRTVIFGGSTVRRIRGPHYF